MCFILLLNHNNVYLFQHVHKHLDAGLDHQAFLGEENRQFNNLSPEESRQRLASLVDKIDTDADGKVSYDELKDWIHKSQKNYIIEDVNRQWETHKQNNENDNISWEDYKRITYGFMNDLEPGMSEEDTKTYKDMMRRDEKRWLAADRNGDKVLNKNEFTDFLHPEESEIMKDVVVDETLEDVDKDKDGLISLSEYIADMYAEPSSNLPIPDWVVREKEQFNNIRDTNKNGFLEREEIAEWIIPQDYDHSAAEAKHLIEESDEDKVRLVPDNK